MTNIGLEHSDKVVKLLEILLASESVHSLKIRKYHRNIETMKFKELHVHFEELYTASYTRADEIAERIRTIGSLVPATYQEFLEKSFIEEDDEMTTNATDMITRLLEDKEEIIREVRKMLEEIWDYNDIGTEDLLTGILSVYEKDAWMLRSMKDS